MNRLLLTGASGFIGTNLLKFCVDKGYEVINIDCRSPQNKQYNQYWSNIDITDFESFKNKVLNFNPDYIIHLAARTDLDGNTLNDYSANTIGVENLMKIVRLVSGLKKVIITSSMLVCHSGYCPKNQYDYSPTTLYGRSKVETEKIVWANEPHCDWVIIRPTSIWGPWFGIPYRNFFDMVMAKRYFHIGNKGCTKTYGYVGNAIYQIEQILLADTKYERQKVFYIGDDPATNIEEWGNEIAAELGFRIKKVPYPLIKCAAWGGDLLKKLGIYFPITSFRLRNMTTDNIIDLSKTYKIAPNPPFTRKDGIKKTLAWLQQNK